MMRGNQRGLLASVVCVVTFGSALPAWSSAREPESAPPPQPVQPEPQPPPPGEVPADPVPSGVEPEGEPEVVLFLKDGSRVPGFLVSTSPAEVVLRIEGIRTPFPAEHVERYQVLPPVLDRYRDLRRAAGDDSEQVRRLAEWLQRRERYDLALAEAERALTLDPASPEARKLRDLLLAQVELHKKAGAGEREGEPVDRPATVRAGKRLRAPVLSPEQINLMKVYELDLADQPRVIVDRWTVEKMIDQYQGHPLIPVTKEGRDALLRSSAVEQLDLMFRLQARDLYGRVQVVDTPRGFRLFRDDVQRTWLLNACSTSQCHGGSEAGRLVFQTARPNSDATVYTNFLIVDRFRLSDGTPLVNWDNPERSPILHMGLPREDSLFPHPVAPVGDAGRDGWRRVFRSPDDPQFRRGIEWIKAMYRPRPEYPVVYQPVRPFVDPGGEANPAPAPAADRRRVVDPTPVPRDGPVERGPAPAPAVRTPKLELPKPSRPSSNEGEERNWPRPPGAPAPTGTPPPEPAGPGEPAPEPK
jgi:hypothetical protein